MNYTWTKDSCGHPLTTDDLQPRTLLAKQVTTATSVDTCTVTTLAISIIFCICGIAANLVNILAFMCNSDVYDDKTPFLMTMVILDLLFLLINIPYFIFQIGYLYLDQSQYSDIGVYIGIRYALSFILICASSWMLVAMVTKKILSTQTEGDATGIKPLGESDQTADSTEENRNLKSSTVCIIVAIPIVATFLHAVKLFEYQKSFHPDSPWLMKWRLTGFGYELYTAIANIAVTILAPYMFLLSSTVYYLVKGVQVMMRKKSEREPNQDIWLLFLLGFLHLVCYGVSLHQQMTALFTKVATVDNYCLDSINTAFIILNASVKIVMFKLFTYHFKRYKLPLNGFSGFLSKQNRRLSRGDVVRSYSFNNPSYDQNRESQ
ncbi:uncharacterized protein LOC117339219 [Pecten maximus]|uniref:uncharacterized protein LOC117339219 n=1 Tax=Pecten maximus TaxID=6579 RepID=UPI0014582317|nr:uncharacterized protein LOC117339219 [Pecten maximus]XP_033756584.1 uncharacterized protein LOC117339219 [Pecten maximus]